MSSKKLIVIAIILFFINPAVFAQDETAKEDEKLTTYNQRFGLEVRGSNAVTLGGGTSILNGDYQDPLWEIYFHAGYKRFLGRYVNINFTYHKFNLAYKDLFNNGFMSFDLNLETNLMPYNSFSIFLYAGGGYHASNYFEETETKVQGGGGLEYLLTERIGLKLFAEYNQVFSDEVDGRIFGETDDVYWRMGLGLNVYFGKFGRTNKISGKVPTVIEKNPIVDDY